MTIDSLVLGDFLTNCYILRQSENSTDCIIIDPGLQPQPLIDFLQNNDLKPLAVILTHGHADHFAGLSTLRQNYQDIKVHIHKLDAEMLADPHANLSLMAAAKFSAQPADNLLSDNDSIDITGINLTVIHTPGHTPGGISLYSKEDDIVFTGDALFAESIGRTDFPSGNADQLLQSIKQKLLTLPEDTDVYPGHGPKTNIKHEKNLNPFLK
jgi:hydroxyacylglutathione hydrolase